MSGGKQTPPPPPPPPVISTAADRAQDTVSAKRREVSRYDWSKTTLRAGGLLPDGTKSTLG